MIFGLVEHISIMCYSAIILFFIIGDQGRGGEHAKMSL